MSSIAKAMLVGNITADPEMRQTPNGKTVASIRVAVNHVFKDADGRKQEEVSYFPVAVFGRQGENCGQYLRKGDSVVVFGRLNQGRWTDDNGQARERIEVIADEVVFGQKARRGSTSALEGSEPAMPIVDGQITDDATVTLAR